MSLRRATTLCTLLAVALLPLAACGDDEGSAERLEMADSTITYSFIGPSVAPEYHDEYTIVVADGTATLSRGTYGVVGGSTEPTQTRTAAVDEAAWHHLVEGLSSLTDDDGHDGCAGGSTFAVIAASRNQVVESVSAYACGADFDRVADAYRAFIAPVAHDLGLDL